MVIKAPIFIIKNAVLTALLFCAIHLSAQKNHSINKSEAQLVDSLNELAFTTKKNDVVKALSLLFNAQKIATQNNYTKGYAVALLYEAGIYQQSGFSNKALAIYQKSLDIFKQTNDSFNIARCNLQIANALLDNEKIDDAEVLYNQSLQTFKQLKLPRQIANVMNNLSQLELRKKNFPLSAQYANEALSISTSIKYKYGIKKALQNLGNIYLEQTNLLKAEQYFVQAKEIDEADIDYYGLAYSDAQLAAIYFKKNELEKTLSIALSGFTAARLANANNLIELNIGHILAVHKKRNELKEINRWQDSLIAISKNQNLLDKQYAINFLDLIKEQELQTLEAKHNALDAERQSEKRLLIIVLGGVFLLISFAFAVIAYINFKKQKVLSDELKDKNLIIEQNNIELDNFNKTISEHNDDLDSQNKMKDKLLSIISHDLRHPLINTKGIIELIHNGLVSNTETTELMKQLEGQYIKTIALLDNLLFWLRGQMKGKAIDLVNINAKTLIKEIVAEQEYSFNNKKISLHNTVTDDVFIKADNEMLKIVFRNLISNAIKFSPVSGSINISYTLNNNMHCFAVKDAGKGISKDAIEKINAHNYYSTDGTLQEKGTGFGIMLCKDLLEKHKGQLLIESETGVGSTFTVMLPIEG